MFSQVFFKILIAVHVHMSASSEGFSLNIIYRVNHSAKHGRARSDSHSVLHACDHICCKREESSQKMWKL